MAAASLIKANNPFLATWKQQPSCIRCRRSPPSHHQVVPNNVCFIKPAKFTTLSINCSNSNSTKDTHQAASPFNFDGQSTKINLTPKKKKNNNFQVVYSAILQTLKKHTVSFVLLGLLSSMMLLHRPYLALAGSMGGRYSSSSSPENKESSSSSSSSSENKEVPSADGFLLTASFLMILCLCYWFATHDYEWSLVDELNKLPTSVLMVKVGLLDPKGSHRKNLNRIFETPDRSLDGWMYKLKESTQYLLQRSDYIISGYSSVNVDSIENGEKNFKQMVNEEHGNFDEETLVDINMKMRSITNQKAKESSDGYLVVTILVYAFGVHELPVINSHEDLNEALQKLCSIPKWRIGGVHRLMWRPPTKMMHHIKST